MNNLAPKPQVIVKPIQTVDPAVIAALDPLKQLVETNGYASIPEYLEWRECHELTDELILPMLQEMGYGFVKSAGVNPDLEQEVIVDLRYMAATMLLIYSDPKFALRHSVLECIKTFYSYGNWKGAVCVYDQLLEEIYGAYGHHFSYMAMADNADLSDEAHDAYSDRDVVQRNHSNLVARNISALNELTKDEEVLTAVFRLCIDVMHIVNTGQAAGKMYRTYRGESKVYNYFWRMACKLRDNARYNEKQTHRCGGDSCCGQCKH